MSIARQKSGETQRRIEWKRQHRLLQQILEIIGLLVLDISTHVSSSWLFQQSWMCSRAHGNRNSSVVRPSIVHLHVRPWHRLSMNPLLTFAVVCLAHALKKSVYILHFFFIFIFFFFYRYFVFVNSGPNGSKRFKHSCKLQSILLTDILQASPAFLSQWQRNLLSCKFWNFIYLNFNGFPVFLNKGP